MLKTVSKRVLLTGGAGFIGSHIVDLFEIQKIDYIVLDNLSSGYLSNISPAIKSGSFIQGDVNNIELMKDLIASSSCVIHLASPVGVKRVIENPLDAIETNINALKFIAHSCSIHKVPLVFFSSSLVYPSSIKNNHSFSEDDRVHSLGFHPVSIYSSSKKIGELICEHYRKAYGLRYIIIRPFNLIGIRQRSDTGMVIPTFIESALKQGVINVYGDGKQTRSFSDVKSAVRLLWELIVKENLYGQIFNLATNDIPISIIQLAELIRDIINKPIKINLIPYNKVFGNSFIDIQARSPQLTKLKLHAKIPKERSLTSILKEIIDYEKDKLFGRHEVT